MTLLRLRGGSGGKEEGGAGAGGGPVRVAGAGAPPLLPPPPPAAEAASGGRRPQPQGGGGERKVLLCGSEDGRISVWDVTSGQFLGMLLGHLSSINSICSNNTRQSSASVDTNGSIHVWSKEMILSCHSFITSMQPKSLLHQSIRGQVTALDMYKDSVIFGETLGNATCYIRVIDYAFQQTGLAVRAETRRHAVVIERDSFILVHPPVVVCIAVCENFVAVALGPPNECVLVYDFESLATLLCLNPATLADLSFPNVHIPEICSMCIHSSSELSKELVLKIVIGGNAGECWLVQCGQHDKKEPFRIISAQFTSKQQDSITSCQYFGGLVVSASLDTTVQVIETTGRMVIDVNVALGLIEGYHQERVWAMQFDYTKIVTGCLDNKVRIFCFI